MPRQPKPVFEKQFVVGEGGAFAGVLPGGSVERSGLQQRCLLMPEMCLSRVEPISDKGVVESLLLSLWSLEIAFFVMARFGKYEKLCDECFL